MTKHDVETLLEGLISLSLDSPLPEHRFTEQQIELVRNYKKRLLELLPILQPFED
ncbi:hypothetical protein HUF18_08095 [Thalassolituus sp. ST750PaO-4]|uniref:hypothetical protein n=1 Tax=Thalassolituus sp. ST750PaO-4 TaxID=2742965 RepID=UPI001CE2BFE7|nr:hypothetical protein [Thalassolituus sp. ST750PaO-4]MCA6059730.1 hypothetical protein [Thalassolituus sp. ST750PaO-4]